MSAFSLLARVSLLAIGLAASLASSGNRPPPPASPAQSGGAPPSQQMDADLAVGLWHSSFGPVKMQLEPQQAGRVVGVWVYDRQGQQVIGSFSGDLSGNVLQFAWEEPAQPVPLRGSGYLVFAPNGTSFTGKWWTETRDRQGEWTGNRQDPYVGRSGSPPPSSPSGTPGPPPGPNDPTAPPPDDEMPPDPRREL